MKICHINLARVFRGGERQTALLIRNLARRGLQQSAVVRKGTRLAKELEGIDNLELIEVRARHWFGGRIAEGVDLLHAHEGKAGHLAYWNSCFSSVPYIITRRVPNPPRTDIVTRQVYRNTKTVVALSKAIADVLTKYDSSLKIEIIPSMVSGMKVNPENVKRLREQCQGYFVVGHIGALQKRHKGQQFLIEAARILSEKHPKLLFLLLGEGEDEAALRTQAAGLDNICFLGFQDAVADYLSVFDIFVFPSLKEGLGSVLLDALQLGKPVIAAGVDGIAEVIRDAENGLLIPPGDPTALANAIVKLYHEDDRRRRLSEAAVKSVDRFSPQLTVDAYVELYRKILIR